VNAARTGLTLSVMRDEHPAAGKMVGRFRLVRWLGAGGTGDVWLAEDTLVPRPVALKLPHPDRIANEKTRREFLREARAGSMLEHPGIAAIYDAGDSPCGPYIAMAFVDGPSLRAVLHGGRTPPEQAVAWIAPAADALAHAHSHGIVHGDISPGNLMIDAGGQVRVVDFGLARSLTGPSDSTRSQGRGTYPYMAPELLRGARPHPLADVYALGAVLYQLVLGELPFPGRSPGAYIRAALDGPPRDPWTIDPRLPGGLRNTLLRALAGQPFDRIQGAFELARDLRSSLVVDDEETRPDAITREPRDRPLPVSPASDEPGSGSDIVPDTQDQGTRALIEARLLQSRAYLRRPDQEASIDGAVAALESLRTFAPEHPEVLAALARACLYKGQLVHDAAWEDRAADLVRRAQAADPHHPEVLLATADLDRIQGRQDDALTGYTRLLAREPGSVSAWVGSSWTHERRGDVDEAEAAAVAAIDAAPGDWRGHSRLGGLLINRGDFQRALAPWRRVVEIAPDHARGWSSYGSVLFQIERFEEALEAFERSIRLQPTTVASLNAGTTLFYLGRYPEALAHYERAIALNPSDARAWGNLGSACHSIEGQAERAREALDRAIVLMREHLDRHDDDATAWSWLAFWLAESNRLDEARTARDRALALAPARLHSLPCMAGTYELLGDDETAIRIYCDRVRNGSGMRALESDPALARLRSTPAWKRVVEASRGHKSGRPA
jgi:serine/threonine-protein kinase